MTWNPPKITLKWGRYFRPDITDEAALVKTATDAHDAGLITRRSAVQRIAETFKISDVSAYMLTLEKENAEKPQQPAEPQESTKPGGAPEEPDQGSNRGNSPSPVK